MKKTLLILFINFFINYSLMSKANAGDILHLELKDGTVIIETFPEVAPNHTKRIVELVQEGFYDGLKFHRVIDGFMVQTGDPEGNGTGGSGQNLKAEFNKIPHKRGILSMARSGHPDSADSQFFIMLEDSFHLDGQYTVWGKVVSGMELVDNIKKGSSFNNGTVENPDKILSFKIAK